MNVRHLFIFICALFVGCSKPTDEEYLASIKSHRVEVDKFMRTSTESPFANGELLYDSLVYFTPNLKYKLNATYQPIGNRKVRNLATSDGKEEAYEEYGYAFFDLDGRQHQLLILKNLSAQSDFFIPFADVSSGQSTYGGGRYLNVKVGNGESTVELDFNKAYNPYCAYNADYICPLPPASNVLSVPILAGEKNYGSK